MSKLFWLIMLFAVILLPSSLITAYAFGDSNDLPGGESVHVEAAGPSTAPSLILLGQAISSVTPGDLFYIDAGASQQDITIELHLTNADELIHNLRYLILKIGIYFEDADGIWQKASLQNGNPAPDTFLTLRNSPVSFTLAGYAKYKVTIDSGNFYCISAKTDGGNPSPQFYLTVEPM